VIPTGGVNASNGAAYREHVGKRGFDAALAMSDPLALVLKEGKPGEAETIKRSLDEFKAQFASGELIKRLSCGGRR